MALIRMFCSARLLIGSGLIGATFLLSGCSQTFWTSTVSRTSPLKNEGVLLTTADLRAVTRTAHSGSAIICAEPSPDVAKIASASFDGSLAASASSVGSVANPELTLALAAARAEGLAQLGQRLATIQLLRDGLYRACEAFANGAINPKIYATILSRYDDVMITMLLGEFAGAKPSPLPALLTGSASGSSTAFAGPSEELKKQMEKIEAAQEEKRKTDDAIAKKEAEVANASAADKPAKEQELAELKTKSAEQEKQIGAMEEAARSMSYAYARSQAQASTNAPTQSPGVAAAADNGMAAAALFGMQKNYLDDFNLDALLVGCLASDNSSQNFCNGLASDHELMKEIGALKAVDVILRDLDGNAERLDTVLLVLTKLREIKKAMTNP